MTLPKTILVPTDFGDPSDAALDYAVELAKVLDAQICLLHAYEIPVMGMPEGAIVATAELTGRVLEGAQLGLDRQIAERTASGVTMRSVIKQGSAYQAVEETAREVGAGLIVMGTHGRRGLPRALIGSVAEKVVRTSSIPVLTVHAAETKRERQKPAEPRDGVGPVSSTHH